MREATRVMPRSGSSTCPPNPSPNPNPDPNPNPNPSQWVFYVTAAVLHLGNLSFTPTAGGEGSALDSHSQQLSALAAHYLQVPTTCSVGLRLGLGLGLD